MKKLLNFIVLLRALLSPNFSKIFAKFFNNNKNIIIFDIGGFQGDFSTEMLKKFPNATLHIFEPDLVAYKTLKSKFINFKNVYLNNFPISSDKKNLVFYDSAIPTISGFHPEKYDKPYLKLRLFILNLLSKEKIKYNEIFTKRKIYTNTLENYCLEKKIHNIDILKIDVEGHEKDILKGSKKLIESNSINLIQLEIISKSKNDFKEKLIEFKKILPNYNCLEIRKHSSLFYFNSKINIHDVLFKKL